MSRLLFLLFLSPAFLLQSQTDTISSSTASDTKRFIGLTIGVGVAWRAYTKVGANEIILSQPQDRETPERAYAFAFKYGVIKKNVTQECGIEYNYARYTNNHATIRDPTFNSTSILTYTYFFSHQFLSLSYSVKYTFGETKKWMAGVSFKAGWLMEYRRHIKSTDPAWLVDDSFGLEKNLTAWLGLSIGRKFIETKKLLLYGDVYSELSSVVGYNKILQMYYPCMFCAPSAREVYESKPHYLLIPSIRLNVHYKL